MYLHFFPSLIYCVMYYAFLFFSLWNSRFDYAHLVSVFAFSFFSMLSIYVYILFLFIY